MSTPQSTGTSYTHEPAWDSGHLKVGSIHEIYYEQYGKKDGLPVIFLHGGPGANTSPQNANYFNPAVYRVVLLDQRGVGKSRPKNELKENTTQHLSDDIERLREHLGIAKWHMVFGGSWGSTLGLFYAQAHPDKVGSLVIRGVFLATRAELYGPGAGDAAAMFFPQEREAFLSFLPENERADPAKAYYDRIISPDPAISRPAAVAWSRWDMTTGTLKPNTESIGMLDDPEWCYTHSLFENHYLFQNGAFIEDGQLLFPENMAKIKDIPGAIVQGRYDVLCPPVTAWKVHKAWPRSSIHFVSDAGHAASEPGTAAKLTQVCDELANL
ncbi:proline iminopeptidase [Xylaria bambusicola]|uniref:proline iminopeptidase n=1 Tax=Xylaria bambusicola TaxID=326684 RepID=UPI002008AED1|nr:proline iminopeptidase [Xylaria bambusicola]KAI0517514.1 proline iminopeptidase [Xylaria bambusicola]